MERIRTHPFETLLAVISAVLILVGRVNHAESWGTPVFIVGIAVLLIAAGLFSVRRR
jgi:hypothetical protein